MIPRHVGIRLTLASRSLRFEKRSHAIDMSWPKTPKLSVKVIKPKVCVVDVVPKGPALASTVLCIAYRIVAHESTKEYGRVLSYVGPRSIVISKKCCSP